VWSGGYSDRSGWETAIYAITLVLLVVAASVIQSSHLALEASIALSVLAFIGLVTLATAVLIKIRFRD
jgi:hypothetical protein